MSLCSRFLLLWDPTIDTRAHIYMHAHEPTRRSTVRGCHKGLGLKRGCYVYRGCLAFDGCCYFKNSSREVKNDPPPTISGVAWAWLALDGRKAIPWLLTRFRDFERPEHTPRSPAGTHTCTVVYRRVPCVPRSREREKKTGGRKRRVLYSGKSPFYT